MKSNENVLTRELLDRHSEFVTETGCRIWTGCRSNGYGVIRAGGKLWRAHAASLEVDGISAGVCVLHKCDTPACINPKHLFLGTRTDNARDRDQKDRVTNGEAHYAMKLTDAQIQAIRDDARCQKDIAADHGITQSHVSRIKSREVRRRA